MSGRCLADTNVIIRLLKSDEHSIALFDEADNLSIPAKANQLTLLTHDSHFLKIDGLRVKN